MEKRLSENDFQELLKNAGEKVFVGHPYQHYKGGMYKVTGLAILENTNEIGVIYQAQYGASLSFIRSLDNWLEEIVVDGRAMKRFEET